MQNKAINIIVKGKVQGVFFRAVTLDKAKELYLKGWVRNLANGDVEILAQGDKENLNKLVEWCKIGTENSTVDSVQIEHISNDESISDFKIKY